MVEAPKQEDVDPEPEKEVTFRVRVDSGRRLAKINFCGKLAIVDGNAVMTFVQHLASARMEMLPEIPPEPNPPPGPADTVRIRNVGVHVDPDTGAIALLLGHPGIGWVGYHLEPSDAQKFLAKLTSAVQSRPRPNQRKRKPH